MEGLAIALSMAEKLVRMGSRVFFVTHFTQIRENPLTADLIRPTR